MSVVEQRKTEEENPLAAGLERTVEWFRERARAG